MRYQISLLLFVIAISATEFGCKMSDSKRDAQIEANLDNRMNYFIQLYGSKEKLEKAAGKTYAEIIAENRDAIVAQLVLEKGKTQNSN